MSTDNEGSYSRGGVRLKQKHIPSCRGSTGDCEALAETIVAQHDAWIRQDLNACLSMSTPEVTRLSQQSGVLQCGRDEVKACMPDEWRAFERAATIDMKMRIRNADLEVEGDTATYEVEVSGGKRWDFDDHALYFQAFVRSGGGWKLVYQTDSWNLDFDSGEEAAIDSLEFDYVYPVGDLDRAVNFYRPILGEPEFRSHTRAAFNLGGARFFLDAGNLHGYAKIKRGLPSGYAEVRVKNLPERMARWKAQGVEFLTGAERQGADLHALVQDPHGNVFVLIEHTIVTAGAEEPAAPAIGAVKDTPKEIVSAVEELMTAWLRMDGDRIAKLTGKDLQWFDDSRCKTRRIGTGAKSIRWDGYDRTSAGLKARMEIEGLRVMPFGRREIASYRMTLTGTGEHPFRERSMVTLIFEGGRVTHCFIVASPTTQAHVLSLDYVASPVTNLKEAADFYTNVMRFGKPYRDEDWRGYWSSASVFGIYVADPRSDGLPRAGWTNGYASFWIKSAQETYDYLKRAGATFPLIGAISNRAGIDREPGYIQIYATDSEGNGVVFTEYPSGG
jgi:catechol 2,3-dioxygenase-like lactoylglutathione lyase family enzyme/ketosteroid isomerase-like protein